MHMFGDKGRGRLVGGKYGEAKGGNERSQRITSTNGDTDEESGRCREAKRMEVRNDNKQKERLKRKRRKKDEAF